MFQANFRRLIVSLVFLGYSVGYATTAEAQSQRYKTGAGGEARQASQQVSGGGALTTNSVLLTAAAAAIIGGIIAVAVDEDDDDNRTTGVGITATSTN